VRRRGIRDPKHLAQLGATTMRKHDGGMLSPLSLCSGDQQRTRERDITIFESDFFPSDGNSRRVRSGLAGLATLPIQIDYVNSPVTSIVAKVSVCRVGDATYKAGIQPHVGEDRFPTRIDLGAEFKDRQTIPCR
jgi:hypothetical protein